MLQKFWVQYSDAILKKRSLLVQKIYNNGYASIFACFALQYLIRTFLALWQ